MRNCNFRLGDPYKSKDERTVKKRLNFIIDELKVEKNMIILDIGTGSGTYISYLSDIAKLCIGIDIVRENLYLAKKKKKENLELLQMDAENIAFKNKTFDSVIIIEAIEHVYNDEKVIKEIYRVLKPKGKLILTAPNKLFPFETHKIRIGSKCNGSKSAGFPFLPYLPEILRRNIASARVYTPWSLKNMLVRNKFSVIRMKFLSPHLYTVMTNYPKIKSYIIKIRDILNDFEKSPILGNFLPTIIISAKK